MGLTYSAGKSSSCSADTMVSGAMSTGRLRMPTLEGFQPLGRFSTTIGGYPRALSVVAPVFAAVLGGAAVLISGMVSASASLITCAGPGVVVRMLF
ncbi:hypothetical protein EVAR_11182_1 [Eumeta japonica]|uniref:Uncharacterized protein n=1 Tax=Eumeta variegata TaxID=151549 RepID=A0A4C1U4C0_EUMVA|nr:hypothetical protein EVAR_11182_1 [Eumeta japonica]